MGRRSAALRCAKSLTSTHGPAARWMSDASFRGSDGKHHCRSKRSAAPTRAAAETGWRAGSSPSSATSPTSFRPDRARSATSRSRASARPFRRRRREKPYCRHPTLSTFTGRLRLARNACLPIICCLSCRLGPRHPQLAVLGGAFQREQQQGAAGDPVNLACGEYPHLGVFGQVGVDQQLPMPTAHGFRQRESDEIVVAVKHHQQCGVPAAPADAGRLGPAIHQHAEALHAHIAPFLGLHLRARGVDPRRILDAQLFVVIAGQKPGTAQDRIFVAQRRQLLHKPPQRRAFILGAPIDPADLVVLAIGVIVALLRPTKLVAGEQHWCSLRQQQGGEEIPHLASPQRAHLFVLGRALDSTIPRTVVGVPIPIFLAVRLVVTIVVGDEVIEREAVMGGDEVDAGPGLAAAVVENVARSAKARSDRAGWRLAAPKVAYDVAELVVPLRPARREAADLIASRTAIPRFGDQFYSAQLRILATGLQKSALIVETVGAAGEDRPEIETK